MSLMDSKGTLAKAAKELFARWEDVKTVWSDSQSVQFEKTYLVPLEQDVRSALTAMEQMNQVLMKIESDCE
jgi:hypothetical protein